MANAGTKSELLASTPKVSVIVASYNGEKYVAETLRSLQAQTLADIEVVIVDDGSRQPTLDILDRFAAEDARFRVYRSEHGGLVATLNKAIGFARGAYIARLDHDDIAKPTRLEKQAAYLDAHSDCVAVGCDVDVIDGTGRLVSAAHIHDEPNPHRPLAFPPRPSWISGPTLMARVSALRAINGYRWQCFAAEDRDISWRLGAVGDVHRVREALVQWREHGANTSVTKYQTQMASHAIGDLSAVAHALGLDDSTILCDVVVGGDYTGIVERYKALIGDRYPVETYWLYFLLRYGVWPLSGCARRGQFLKKVAGHVAAAPFDRRRLKVVQYAIKSLQRGKLQTLAPQQSVS